MVDHHLHSRWTWAVVVAFAAIVVLVAVVLPRPGVEREASAQSVEPAVACLDDRLRPLDDCPTVDVDVTAAVRGDQLVVAVANAGSRAWAGGPLALEVPIGPSRTTSRTEPPTEVQPGTAHLVDRAGVQVARCEFDPVERLDASAAVDCRVPRRLLRDGRIGMWITGFVGGLPPVGGPLGADAAPVGVVPVATSRSIAVDLAGSRVAIVAVDPPRSAAAQRPEGSEQGGGWALWLALAVPAVAGAIAVASPLAHRRRRRI